MCRSWLHCPQNIVMYSQYPVRNKLPFPWFYDCVGVDVYIVISYIATKNGMKLRVDNILEIYHVILSLTQDYV